MSQTDQSDTGYGRSSLKLTHSPLGASFTAIQYDTSISTLKFPFCAKGSTVNEPLSSLQVTLAASHLQQALTVALSLLK